jgi:sterol desaturase/sphingolipid hydroxylase (fatty acid hydroxylase superfamily)
MQTLVCPWPSDRAISLVFVSPNMHKAHHHFERPLTDTNFSNIFSLWDRMLGTFAYEDPSKLKYGLDVLDETKDENLKYQMQLPSIKKSRPIINHAFSNMHANTLCSVADFIKV